MITQNYLITKINSMNTTLRTPEMEQRYQEHLASGDKGCCFCRELEKFKNGEPTTVKRVWGYWMLMSNEYYYDAFYKVHDMLAPLRHVEWPDIMMKEFKEYERIVEELEKKYHQGIKNFGDTQSQPGHYHLHYLNR